MNISDIKWINSIRDYRPNQQARFFIAGFLCYLAIVLIIVFLVFPKQELRVHVGEVSQKDYTAPYDIEFVNSERTEEARKLFDERIQPIRKVSEKLNEEYFTQLDEFRVFINSLQNGADEQLNKSFSTLLKKSFWPKLEASGFTINDLKALLLLPPPARIEYFKQLGQVQTTVLRGAIAEDRLEMHRNQVRNLIRSKEKQGPSPEISEKIVFSFIGPNSETDNESTQKLIDAQKSHFKEITEKVSKNEIFLRKGEVINQRHIDILKTQFGIESLKEVRTRIKKLFTMCLLSLAGFLIFWYFMGKLTSNPLKDSRLYYLFLVQTLITIVLGILITRLFPGEGLQYLLLIALLTNAWVVTYFISVETSLLSTLFQGAFLALAFNLDRSFLLSSMITGAISSFLIKRDCRHIDILRGTILIILVGSITIIAVNLLLNEPLKMIPQFLLYNLTASIVALVVMLGLTMVYVPMFNIITRYHLIDLSDINHPLIRQLRRNAPGSYHHSLIVGDLAEIAAESIGVNGLLARVATLYHDIGKAKMPHFFIENQAGKENPHDRYPPSLSRLVMLSHVKDGIHIAKKARLPNEIIDAIQQHHGTTLMTYFFNKALAQSDGNAIDEFDYRYEGPKPQYPEMVIIALADTAESVVRSLDEPTPHRIESTINSIFRQRLLDGQYDECGLSISQLEKIKETIIETLSGIYHSRIEYPDVQELKSRLEKHIHTKEKEEGPIDKADEKSGNQIEQDQTGEPKGQVRDG